MSDTHNPVDVGVHSKLTGATALTSLLTGGTANPAVYQWLAPEGADPPYVVYQPQSPSTPLQTFGTVIFENVLFAVKGVTEGHTAAAAGTIAKEIDAALHDQTLTISGYGHRLCRREQNIDYIELEAGKRFTHRGALYRVWAQPN